jgi:2-C-methyl-D-erythritol 4-phosphate cytidylyltransferase
VGAVLVAAGASRRMGFDKLWCPLSGQPVLSYALQVIATSPRIDRVALVVASERLGEARALADAAGNSVLACVGADQRRASVACGLALLHDCAWIVVHDAARPFLTEELIGRGLEAAGVTGAAVAAQPVRDTIKRVANGIVLETLPRSQIWSVQTPQVFRADLLRSALQRPDEDVTDEATLVERMGGQVQVFAGSDANIKITTPSDLDLAEAWLALGRQAAAIS